MAGEVYVGKLTSGHMVIGESNTDGLQKAYVIILSPDPQNQQRIAINMKSLFWPISDEGASISREQLVAITEVSQGDIIQEYVRTKTGGKLDVVTGAEASQVMKQLNQQMSKAQKGVKEK